MFDRVRVLSVSRNFDEVESRQGKLKRHQRWPYNTIHRFFLLFLLFRSIRVDFLDRPVNVRWWWWWRVILFVFFLFWSFVNGLRLDPKRICHQQFPPASAKNNKIPRRIFCRKKSIFFLNKQKFWDEEFNCFFRLFLSLLTWGQRIQMKEEEKPTHVPYWWWKTHAIRLFASLPSQKRPILRLPFC